MKALSIQQPWAWLIVQGYKDIENRTWNTKFRGEFLIHASQRMDWDAFQQVFQIVPNVDMPCAAALPRGGIVGKATLVDVVRESSSPWFHGPWGFVLEGAEPVAFSLYRGQFGFWNVEYPG